MTPWHPPVLLRTPNGGVATGLSAGTLGSAPLLGCWDGLRAVQFKLRWRETPSGPFTNHLLAVNMGEGTIAGVNLEGRGWMPVPTPHQSVSFVPAGVDHDSRMRTGCEMLLVEIEPELVKDVLGGGPGAPSLPVLLAEEDGFAVQVALAIAAQARQPGRSPAAVKGLAQSLLLHLAERGARAAQPSPRADALASPTLGSVLDHIAANLDAPLSLARLAAVAGMNLYTFARAFKQSTGVSPHRYLLEARIARAKELLLDRALPIAEVAGRAGFASASHFAVTFRQYTGVTPRAFREGQGAV